MVGIRKSATLAVTLLSASTVDLLSSTPCYAGCLCDLVTLTVSAAGVAMSAAFLVGAITILFTHKWAVSARLAAAAIVTYLVASSTAAAINSGGFGSVNPTTAFHWNVLLSILILTAVAFLLGYILPSIVAFKRSKNNRKAILVLNILLGLLPVVWNVLLYLSFMDDKKTTTT